TLGSLSMAALVWWSRWRSYPQTLGLEAQRHQLLAADTAADVQRCTAVGRGNVSASDFWAIASSVAEGYPVAYHKYLRLLALSLTGSLPTINAVGKKTWLARSCGNDWPKTGYTMVGFARLKNIAKLVLDVVSNGIQGDFAELGVWRGGSCVFAKALFDVLGETERGVHLFDVFAPLENYRGSQDFLAVDQKMVERSFDVFGVRDEGVQFHKGLFKDSLKKFAEESDSSKLAIAILRIDANFHDSYQDALYYMYDFIPVGGFVIFDDIMTHPAAMNAWKEFKQDQNLDETPIQIDKHSAYFQKKKAIKVDRSKMRPFTDANK
ncbi:novP, partial [Symbiodinium natans]